MSYTITKSTTSINPARRTIGFGLVKAAKILADGIGESSNTLVKYLFADAPDGNEPTDEEMAVLMEALDKDLAKRCGSTTYRLLNRPVEGREPTKCYWNAWKQMKATGDPAVLGWELTSVGHTFIVTPHAVNHNKEVGYYDTEHFSKGKQGAFRCFMPRMTPEESKTFLSSLVLKKEWPFIPTLKWGGLVIITYKKELYVLETKGQAELEEGQTYTYAGKLLVK